MAQYFPENYIQQNNDWNPTVWYNNAIFYGQHQINTTFNYQCQYIMYPYPIYPTPQYFYYYYLYTPNTQQQQQQQILYNPYNRNVQIENNCPSTSDGYTSMCCVECRNNGIQTDVMANDSIYIQTDDNVQHIDVAIQPDIATQNSVAIQTLSIESEAIEIQSDIVTLNSVSVQTEMSQESVHLQTENDPNPCISTDEDVSQLEESESESEFESESESEFESESEEEEDNFVFVMESTDFLNLKSCLRARSAYEEEEVTEGANHRPEIRRKIRFNDWLNKVKLI